MDSVEDNAYHYGVRVEKKKGCKERNKMYGME